MQEATGISESPSDAEGGKVVRFTPRALLKGGRLVLENKKPKKERQCAKRRTKHNGESGRSSHNPRVITVMQKRRVTSSVVLMRGDC